MTGALQRGTFGMVLQALVPVGRAHAGGAGPQGITIPVCAYAKKLRTRKWPPHARAARSDRLVDGHLLMVELIPIDGPIGTYGWSSRHLLMVQ